MQATAHRFEEWILGSLTSGIVAIDQDGCLVTLNAGAQRILGCPRGEPDAAIGRDCREVLRSQPAVARLLLDTLDGRAPLSRAELVLDGDAGRLREHDRLHARAGARRRRPGSRRGDPLPRPHALRTRRRAGTPARAARRARADGRGNGARDPQPAREHGGARGSAEAAPRGPARGARAAHPAEERAAQRWRNRSPRASSSCGRFRSRAARSMPGSWSRNRCASRPSA